MSDSIRHAYLAAVRVDLGVFLRQAFATVHLGRVVLDNWHLEAIVNVLEHAMQGQLPRLIINLPPRHLKSLLLSVAWPAFILGQDPTAKIIVVSYADELAKPLAREFRRIVESAWYRRLFPNVRLVKATENEVATDAGGGRYATTGHPDRQRRRLHHRGRPGKARGDAVRHGAQRDQRLVPQHAAVAAR